MKTQYTKNLFFTDTFNGQAMTIERLRQYVHEVMVANDAIIEDVVNRNAR